jgi:hypothetical protein
MVPAGGLEVRGGSYGLVSKPDIDCMWDTVDCRELRADTWRLK